MPSPFAFQSAKKSAWATNGFDIEMNSTFELFNTSLIYELGVLKAEAEPLLEDITNDQPQYAEAQRLLELLRYFEPISKDIVPSHSLLKEFLGGGDFKG